VDENLIKQYYLSDQKKNLKRMLWEAKHGDWMKQQELKAKDREFNKKKTKQPEVIMSQVSAMSASGMEPSELAKGQVDGDAVSSEILSHSDPADQNSQAGEKASIKKMPTLPAAFQTPSRKVIRSQVLSGMKQIKSGANTPIRPLDIGKKA